MDLKPIRFLSGTCGLSSDLDLCSGLKDAYLATEMGAHNRNSSPNLRIRTRMYDRVIFGHMAIT